MGMLLDDDPLDLLTAEAIDIVLGPDPTISRVVAASEFDYIVARFGVIVLYGLQVLPAPEDIPSGSDDDVVARQLREAAMREPDPAVREKLWAEYRKYKGISP